MGRPLKIASTGVDLGFPNLYGVVAGDTGTAGLQILARAKITGKAEADAFIIRQKGSRKFLVRDANGEEGVCTLVDGTTGALGDGEMLIIITDAATNTYNLKHIGNKFGVTFGNVGYYLTFGAASATKPAPGLYEIAQVTSG
jgi:hypothetical protein